MLSLGTFELQCQLVRSVVYSRDPGAELELDPRAREYTLQCRAELAIHIRYDVIEDLDDRDLGAEPPPHRAEFEPDITATDDDEPVRHAVKGQCAGRRNDALLVDLDARQRGALRTCRNDDRGRLDLLGRAVCGHGNPPWSGDPSPALDPVDLVLAKQELDTAGQGRHDLVFAAHHRCEIQRHFADLDAVLSEIPPDFGEFFRRLQQRLRRDAAD